MAMLTNKLAKEQRVSAQRTDVTAKLLSHEVMHTWLQVNCVVAGGDEAAYRVLRGYRDNAILVRLQSFSQE
ncbi:MAG: hypothetical protein OEQ25_03375 [Gammaproteobacteria bacterium]|nr:hypothetical protein [Gammaproteobacteria bacterium]MDH3506158.1 hypothetical protein [Gammaproteobacteria bacterium]